VFNLLHNIRSNFATLKRMLFWGWNLRNSYDFDANTVYRVLFLKLERIHNEMKYNSHLDWNSTESSKLMKRLCEAKMLAKKLSEQEYQKNYNFIKQKYKNTEGNNRIFILIDMEKSWYPNAKNIDRKTFNFFIKASFSKDRKEYIIDKNRLFYLLNKYLEHWWD